MEHRTAAVASRAIELALTKGSFKSSDVTRPFSDPPAPATVRRILRQLESDEWLQREGPRSTIWRAGVQARMLGDMSNSTVEEADREPVRPGEDTGASDDRGLDFDFSL